MDGQDLQDFLLDGGGESAGFDEGFRAGILDSSLRSE